MKEEQTHIELFDLYLRNELPDTDKIDFEKKLDLDKDFKQQFTNYLLIVEGIKLRERDELKAFMKKEAKMEYWGQNFWGKNWTYASAALLLIFASLYIVTKQFNNSNSKQENDLAIEQHKEKENVTTEEKSENKIEIPETEKININISKTDNIESRKDAIPQIAESESAGDFSIQNDDVSLSNENIEIDVEKKISEKTIAINEANEINLADNVLWNATPTTTTLPSNASTNNTYNDRIYKKGKISSKKNADNTTKAEESHKKEVIDTGIIEKKINTKTEKITIQFWSSPLNFKGYQYNNKLLKLYGIIENNPKLYQYNGELYLVNGGIVYKINNCTETCQYEEVSDLNIKNTILNQP